MRQVVLYIAMSLDGYIADGEGNVAWISGQDDSVENKDTYSDFIKNVDTILMGWNTYHQVTAVLSPAEWVMRDITRLFLLIVRLRIKGRSILRMNRRKNLWKG